MVPWLRLRAPTAGAQVQSLNVELRSHMLHGVANEKMLEGYLKKERECQLQLFYKIPEQMYLQFFRLGHICGTEHQIGAWISRCVRTC